MLTKIVPQVPFHRASLHALPQLTIPANRLTRVDAHPSSPETPASLSSPITGVIDLTRFVKTTDGSPVTIGGCSDIYKGEWTGECPDGADGGKQADTVVVAIKLIRVLVVQDLDCIKARKRLNREVYVWHRLRHPNIVKLFGTSYHMGGRPSMVMQWYKNGSASDYLKGRECSTLERLALVLDVARGLEYLHTLAPPIVHGDLKGNNVLVTDDCHAVLSDFGLSEVIEDLVGPTGYTPSNPGFGPLRWQAPEFIEDETCKPGLLTDVWGFGCTVYELLTSNVPYYYRSRDGQVIKDIQGGIKPPGPEGLTVDGPCGASKRLQDILYNHCWSSCPSDRLQMVDISSQLGDVYVSWGHYK